MMHASGSPPSLSSSRIPCCTTWFDSHIDQCVTGRLRMQEARHVCRWLMDGRMTSSRFLDYLDPWPQASLLIYSRVSRSRPVMPLLSLFISLGTGAREMQGLMSGTWYTSAECIDNQAEEYHPTYDCDRIAISVKIFLAGGKDVRQL